MRRRVGLMSSVVALLAITLASVPVAAGQAYYYNSIANATCYLNGGAFGNGSVVADAHMEEAGDSNTNYFYMIAYLQELQGGVWYDIDWRDAYSDRFPDNNSTSHYFNHHFKIPVVDNSVYYHRIDVVYQWWKSRASGDRLVWQVERHGRKC